MRLSIQIQRENSKYYSQVEDVVKLAFEDAPYTNGKEWQLVKKLRSSRSFVQDLSLIAFCDGKVIGHVLLSPIQIYSGSRSVHTSLALAPISVLPDFQNNGVGSKLIYAAHEAARDRQFKSIILLGYPGYYRRFGYQAASKWNIHPPFTVPDETFMAAELEAGALSLVNGTAEYPPEFDE